MYAITNWHVVVAGFMQSKFRANGMTELFRWLHYKVHKRNGAHDRVEFLTWNSDMKSQAEFIWRLSHRTGAHIHIYAYSWGAGQGARRLCHELHKRGLRVHIMVLSDPVYRHVRWGFEWLPDWLQWLGQWRSMCRKYTVKYPDNIDRVIIFGQRQNRPQCHACHFGETTTIHGPYILDGFTHQYMDDAPPFQRACQLMAFDPNIPEDFVNSEAFFAYLESNQSP